MPSLVSSSSQPDESPAASLLLFPAGGGATLAGLATGSHLVSSGVGATGVGATGVGATRVGGVRSAGTPPLILMFSTCKHYTCYIWETCVDIHRVSRAPLGYVPAGQGPHAFFRSSGLFGPQQFILCWPAGPVTFRSMINACTSFSAQFHGALSATKISDMLLNYQCKLNNYLTGFALFVIPRLRPRDSSPTNMRTSPHFHVAPCKHSDHYFQRHHSR